MKKGARFGIEIMNKTRELAILQSGIREMSQQDQEIPVNNVEKIKLLLRERRKNPHKAFVVTYTSNQLHGKKD